MEMFKNLFKNNTSVTNISGNNSSIIINGRKIVGSKIKITGIEVDGVDYRNEGEDTLTIIINGDVSSVDCQVVDKIQITGNVGEVSADVGDIDITGEIKGNVKSNVGDIKIKGNVGGKVKTDVGDIKYNKP